MGVGTNTRAALEVCTAEDGAVCDRCRGVLWLSKRLC